MATFFSEEIVDYWSDPNNYVYGTLTGNVSRSGNTVTLSNLQIELTPRYSSYGTSSWDFQIEGDTVFDDTISAPPRTLSLNSVSFGVSAAQTSKTVSWRGPGGTYSGSFTVNFPAGATGPSGGYISSKNPGTDTITLTGGITNNGTGATKTYVELIVLERAYTEGGIPQRFEGFNAMSATKTITNSSSISAGGITISPNKRYYAGVYADNGVEVYRYDGGTVVTKAKAPTVELTSVEGDEATFSYSQPADGGYYTKYVEYSLDGGSSWTTAATISGTSASSGTFTISGLSSGTTYTIKTRTRTTAGSSTAPDIEFTVGAVKGVVPVNGTLTELGSILGSVDGTATQITKILYSKNGIATKP